MNKIMLAMFGTAFLAVCGSSTAVAGEITGYRQPVNYQSHAADPQNRRFYSRSGFVLS